jgi:hypothetical protein
MQNRFHISGIVDGCVIGKAGHTGCNDQQGSSKFHDHLLSENSAA